jgi:hypothetical protein
MSAHQCVPAKVNELQLTEELIRSAVKTKRLQASVDALQGRDLAAKVALNSAAVAELEASRVAEQAAELLRGACRKCELGKTCCASMCKGE